MHFTDGWVGGKSLVNLSSEEISSRLDQPVWTTFHPAQAFVPGLQKKLWGRIIIISSPIVTTLPGNNVPYNIAKSGEEVLILSLAEELKYSGGTANIIRVRSIDVKHVRDSSRTPKNASWTTPEEITTTIGYLCSDEAGVVNGVKLV